MEAERRKRMARAIAEVRRAARDEELARAKRYGQRTLFDATAPERLKRAIADFVDVLGE
jgi:hypothetical protein